MNRHQPTPSRTPVDPLDANFLSLDTPATQQAIASLFLLESVPEEKIILERCLKSTAQFPRITQRVDPHVQQYWETDSAFNLKNHVRYHYLPRVRSQEDLVAEASRLFSQRFDFSHPLWGLDIIVGEQNSVCGVLFKIHHALADGLGALQFFYSLCGMEQKEEAGGQELSGSSFRVPQSMSWMRSVVRLFVEALTPGPKSALNGSNSSGRELSFAEFSLKDLRQLKRIAKASTNDVMLALATRAVERYLRDRGKVVKDLKILMPFNLRKSFSRDALGNHLTGIGLRLPVSLNNIRQQLIAISRNIEQIKSNGSFGAYGLMGRLTGALPVKLRIWLCQAAAKQTNFICTNVPGPQQPLYFGGAKITGNYGFAALMKHHGIAFAFMSYVGRMFVSVVSDPNIVPDGQELIRYFRDAFEELREQNEPANATLSQSAVV